MMRRLALAAIVCAALAGCGQDAATPGHLEESNQMSTPSERSESPSSRVAPVPPKVDTGMSVLDPRSKKLLDKARAAGQEAVDVLALTSVDNVGKLVGQLEGLGATIDKADSRTGYLRAKIPIPSISKAAHLPGVQSMQLAEPILRDDPTP